MPARKSFCASLEPLDKIVVEIDIEKARRIVSKIIYNPDYLRQLKRRALAGVLAPAVEMMLWHYLFGKPRDIVDVNVTHKGEDLTQIPNKELAERARLLSVKILKEENQDEEPDPPMN